MKSQFSPLSHSSSVKMTILRDVVNAFGLLNVVWKIDSHRQAKNPYTCVATCFYTFSNITLPYLSIKYYYEPLLLSISSSLLYTVLHELHGPQPGRKVWNTSSQVDFHSPSFQVFERRSCYSTDLHSRQIT